jgi:uncharacterized protein (TIGR02001 family)
MKKLILAVAVMGAFATSVQAQEAATPEHTFTGNMTVATDYRFRGLSQTFKEPTIQGGFDYAHSSGFYVGNWNSNVDTSAINNGNIEMDFYGGYKFAIAPDLTGDVGVLHYYYPGAATASGKTINTTEVYVGAAYKWFSAKYSHTTSDFFGVDNSKGSGYLDLGAAFEVAEKTTLSFHVGRQKVAHNGASDYTDYKVGIARDFGFATISLAAIGTNAKDDLPLTKNGKTKKTGDTTAVLSISKTF